MQEVRRCSRQRCCSRLPWPHPPSARKQVRMTAPGSSAAARRLHPRRLRSAARRRARPPRRCQLEQRFRFTPATASRRRAAEAVRVAVRARADTPADRRPPMPGRALASAGHRDHARAPTISASRSAGAASPFPATSPRSDGGTDPGRARIGPGRHELLADPPLHRPRRGRRRARRGRASGIIAEDQAYPLDVGGAYRIARNIDVTARRPLPHLPRPARAAADDRRDSQAVYIGTAFRF